VIPVAEQFESCYNLHYLATPICNRRGQIDSELKVPERRAKAWVSGRARPGTYSAISYFMDLRQPLPAYTQGCEFIGVFCTGLY
jgi:hypothetical protein